MKILVTGGNGYVARRLYHGLKNLYPIIPEPRSRLDLTDGCFVSDYLSRERYDVIIHTAAVGGSRLRPDDSSIMDANLLMYYNLLSNKKKFGRLISFGSGAEVFMPNSPYGMSKKIIAESMRNTENFYNIRLFSVFDEAELPTRFIKSSIMRYLSNQPMVVHQNKIMDFFYMKDLISLVNHFITADSPQKEIECCYPNKHTLSEVASFVNELSDHRVQITISEKRSLEFYCGGTNPMPIDVIGLRKGILETYQRIKENLSNEHTLI